MNYRCRQGGAGFSSFTGTALDGLRDPCKTILLRLRGFAQGKRTPHLAEELACDSSKLLKWRHDLQAFAEAMAAQQDLTEPHDAIDEVY
ncbi:MAG: hypothetical protein R3E79_30290 [Caldilineaceae bacterium]